MVLKKYAVKNGVEYISDTVTKVVQNEDGSIKEVELKNGKPVAGDLFIDCSGFKSLLIGETLNEPFDDLYDTLFNDRAIAMQVDYEDKDKEIVVPSGNPEWNRERMKTAIEVNEKNGLNAAGKQKPSIF